MRAVMREAGRLGRQAGRQAGRQVGGTHVQEEQRNVGRQRRVLHTHRYGLFARLKDHNTKNGPFGN